MSASQWHSHGGKWRGDKSPQTFLPGYFSNSFKSVEIMSKEGLGRYLYSMTGKQRCFLRVKKGFLIKKGVVLKIFPGD